MCWEAATAIATSLAVLAIAGRAVIDELFEPDGQPRKSAVPLITRISTLPDGELRRRQLAAESALLQRGTYSAWRGNGGPSLALRLLPSAQQWNSMLCDAWLVVSHVTDWLFKTVKILAMATYWAFLYYRLAKRHHRVFVLALGALQIVSLGIFVHFMHSYR